jgi:hypothetical protein
MLRSLPSMRCYSVPLYAVRYPAGVFFSAALRMFLYDLPCPRSTGKLEHLLEAFAEQVQSAGDLHWSLQSVRLLNATCVTLFYFCIAVLHVQPRSVLGLGCSVDAGVRHADSEH